MLKLIYDRYVAAGGRLSFDDLVHPLGGLFRLAVVDGEPVLTKWDDSLDELGVEKPTVQELAAALVSTSFEGAKSALSTKVDAMAQSRLDAGAPASDTLFRLGEIDGGLHVSLDHASRTDLSAMATTAIAASSGAVEWPESYRRGWITAENIRIPLPTPADGLALAAATGDHYAKIRQHARDLKDAIIAADTEAALLAIDVDADWP